MSKTHNEWFKRVTRGDSIRQASDRAGISNVTLGRQLKAGELSADLIIKIAQSYDESPVVALIDLGFISARWVNELGSTTALTRASDEELTDELLRRLKLLPDAPVDDLAAKRKVEIMSDADDMNDGTVRPFNYSEYAADSSEDENERRLERGEDLID